MPKHRRIHDSEMVVGIKARMAVLGLNASELAERSGLAPSTVSSILNGQSDPGAATTLKPLATALGLTRSELFDEGEALLERDRARRQRREREVRRARLEVGDDLDLAVEILRRASPEDRRAALMRLQRGEDDSGGGA